MDMNAVKEWMRLDAEAKALDAEAKEIKNRRDEIAETLSEEFVEDGVASIKCDGRTVYLHVDTYASCGGDVPSVLAAIQAEGIDGLTTVNSSKLRALVKEESPERFIINHPGLAGLVKIEERVSIRSRAS